jgi:hypothetical protein
MATDNSRLVFEHGNQWGKEKDAGPFFGMPAAWRRFIFQVLTNRELAVYAYVCSVMDPNAIAYPTPEQIAEDMGVRTRSVIVDALNVLVEKGFLLAGADPRPGRMSKRTVYQRPLPHHTLKTLLEKDLIDADLFPVANKARKDELTRASDDVVRASLKAMLGEQVFRFFSVLKDTERRKKVLLATFGDFVEARVKEKREELAVKLVQEKDFKKFFGGEIPDYLRDLIAEEQPNAAAGIKTPF